jgi:protein tyrosine/serine phosphatase
MPLPFRRLGLVPVLLLSCALVSSSSLAGDRPSTEAGSVASVEHPAAHRVSFEGIPNFAEVTPALYRGAQPSKQGLAKLADMNVAIVVDLRSSRNETEASAVEKLGMQYLSIPSRCPFPRDQNFVHLLQLIRGNPDKKIFVHCRLGTDRTGMAIAAYRMAEENWTAEEAMQEMQAFGFNTFHRAICPGLAEYEHSFPERLKHDAPFQALRSPIAASGSR